MQNILKKRSELNKEKNSKNDDKEYVHDLDLKLGFKS